VRKSVLAAGGTVRIGPCKHSGGVALPDSVPQMAKPIFFLESRRHCKRLVFVWSTKTVKEFEDETVFDAI
jgi:hypothetical protein